MARCGGLLERQDGGAGRGAEWRGRGGRVASWWEVRRCGAGSWMASCAGGGGAVKGGVLVKAFLVGQSCEVFLFSFLFLL